LLWFELAEVHDESDEPARQYCILEQSLECRSVIAVSVASEFRSKDEESWVSRQLDDFFDSFDDFLLQQQHNKLCLRESGL
jgi:hypothetical protein